MEIIEDEDLRFGLKPLKKNLGSYQEKAISLNK